MNGSRNKNNKFTLVLTTIFICLIQFVCVNTWSQVSAVYGGGPFFSGGQTVMNDLRNSGFNTAILWTIHVGENGNMNFNDIPVIDTNGNYVGDSNWAIRLATLKQAPTSIDRIELGVASAGGSDFQNIDNLIRAKGIGPETVLYKAFANLKTVTGADAINIDDESHFNINATVQFILMVSNIGYKVAFAPYNQTNFWREVFSQVEAQRPGTIDRVYLQVYAGGAGNNPLFWNQFFGSLKVIPGVWSIHGDNDACNQGDAPASVQTRMNNWRSDISGGFIWIYDDIAECSRTGRTTADYANAINMALNIPGAGSTTNIAPEATITVSSEYSSRYSKEKLVDRITGRDGVGEWASRGEDRPFAQLEWSAPVLVNKVVLFDRPTLREGITSGRLTFSDGSTVNVPGLDDGGAPRTVNFSERSTTLVRFDVTGNEGGANPGLAEFQVFSSTSASVPTPTPSPRFTVNIAPNATISVSTEYSARYSKEKLIDGITGRDGVGEWACRGEQRPSVQLQWSTPVAVDRVVLFDRPTLREGITSGILIFSDGTTIDVPALDDGGAPREIIFSERTITSVRFDVTGSEGGANPGLSEFRVFGGNPR